MDWMNAVEFFYVIGKVNWFTNSVKYKPKISLNSNNLAAFTTVYLILLYFDKIMHMQQV